MKLAKYKFDSKEQFNSKINSLDNVKFDKIELGNIVVSTAVYLGDDIIEQAVLSNDYHVDMVWYELTSHPYGWKSYSVDVVGSGSHSIAGLDYNDYKF